MTRPEEQESQARDEFDDPDHHMQSFPPVGPRGAGHGVQDADHETPPDFRSQQLETQQDSLESLVEDTQFVGLEPLTQVAGESQASFQSPAKQSQPSVSRPISPAYAFAITRPETDGLADGGGFKFGQAQKTPKLNMSRQPGKALNTPRPAPSMGPSKNSRSKLNSFKSFCVN